MQCAMLVVAGSSIKTLHNGVCHDSCDLNWSYSGEKANLPALVCLYSVRERYGAVIVAVEFNNMQTMIGWQSWELLNREQC